MFEGKTMFVVGAGASREADLPTGAQLKIQIADLLNFEIRPDESGMRHTGDDEIFKALRRFTNSPNVRFPDAEHQKYLAAARLIRDALPLAPSIDNLLDSHNGNPLVERCGKLAIVKAILKAERASKLWVDDGNTNNKLDTAKLADTWYVELAQLLFACRKEELPKRLSQIQFIVFNYDRCIEHFLLWGLRIYFDLKEVEAAELLKLVKIYHPYGTVGLLPWQTGNGSHVAFGPTDTTPDLLLNLTKEIKTFTEGTDPDSSEIVELRQALDDAEIVVFLGFGFHKLNMELIGPVTRRIPSGDEKKAYYATAKGMSESDTEIIRNQLHALCSVGMGAAPIQIRHDLYCYQLFREYHLSLAQ